MLDSPSQLAHNSFSSVGVDPPRSGHVLPALSLIHLILPWPDRVYVALLGPITSDQTPSIFQTLGFACPIVLYDHQDQTFSRTEISFSLASSNFFGVY